jgi:hypothetical protein
VGLVVSGPRHDETVSRTGHPVGSWWVCEKQIPCGNDSKNSKCKNKSKVQEQDRKDTSEDGLRLFGVGGWAEAYGLAGFSGFSGGVEDPHYGHVGVEGGEVAVGV